MMRLDRRAWPLVVAFVLLAVGHAAAEAVREVGFVERFTGESEHHEILREGAAVPVAVFAPLQAGDRIAVRQPGEVLVLRINDEPVELTSELDALVLDEGPEGATIATNLAIWAGEWISGDSGPDTTRVTLSTRSMDLAAPSFGDGPVSLVAGRRALTLAWRGGHPPYELRLERVTPDASELGAWQVAEGAHFTSPRLELREGGHRLTLRDAAGAEIARELRVVATPPASPIPGDEPLHQTLSAAWLAGHEEGRWRFEAYQRVVGLRESYAPAAVLAEALEGGASAPDPSAR